MKMTFLDSDKISKAGAIGFILWIFSLYGTLFIYVLIVLLLIFLFRKVPFEINDKRTLESNVYVSPVSGVVKNIYKSELKCFIEVKIGPLNEYGIYLPLGTTISSTNFDKSQSLVEFNFKDQALRLSFNSLTSYFPCKLFIESGDRGSLGANIGYLPFGGKTVIELPKDSKVLVKEGDQVKSFQTLLAKIG